MIRVRRLRVTLGGSVVLDGVSVDVAAGEWAALIGPNGAGKTTLLRAIAGLIRADGEVTIAGRPGHGISRRMLARLVAFVPQHPQFPADMTGAEYVLLGRTPHIGYLGVESAADRRACAGLLAEFGIARLAPRRLSTMSGGELQRLVLARALAQEAPVLLLDEPTSALDLGRRVEALELIDGLRRKRSLTVLSAVHDLTLAGQFADRLVLLAGGRVAADGPPAAILRPELLGPHFGAGVEVIATAGGDLTVITRRPARPAAP